MGLTQSNTNVLIEMGKNYALITKTFCLEKAKVVHNCVLNTLVKLLFQILVFFSFASHVQKTLQEHFKGGKMYFDSQF